MRIKIGIGICSRLGGRDVLSMALFIDVVESVY